ncbi:MAG: hypothetical protein Q4B28_05615 [bacterium]|nr:hypothetical protein [bacterium]
MHNRWGGYSLVAGEYLYQKVKSSRGDSAILVAKMERATHANYVLALPTTANHTRPGSGGGLDTVQTLQGIGTSTPMERLDDIHLCASISKGEQASWTLQADGSYHCSYSSDDQLYYIHKIE